jgi:hypothetical protein
LKVVDSLVYDRYEHVFSEYVSRFTSIRELGGYHNVFGKLMINSLYGSMALREESEFIKITYSSKERDYIFKNMTVLKS